MYIILLNTSARKKYNNYFLILYISIKSITKYFCLFMLIRNEHNVCEIWKTISTLLAIFCICRWAIDDKKINTILYAYSFIIEKANINSGAYTTSTIKNINTMKNILRLSFKTSFQPFQLKFSFMWNKSRI